MGLGERTSFLSFDTKVLLFLNTANILQFFLAPLCHIYRFNTEFQRFNKVRIRYDGRKEDPIPFSRQVSEGGIGCEMFSKTFRCYTSEGLSQSYFISVSLTRSRNLDRQSLYAIPTAIFHVRAQIFLKNRH